MATKSDRRSNRTDRSTATATPEQRAVDRMLARCHRRDDGCWILPGNGKWYPKVSVAGRVMNGHRVVYATMVGEIPQGAHIHHRCEHPRCIRPEHLEAITPTDHQHRHHFNEACPRCGGQEWYAWRGNARKGCRTCRLTYRAPFPDRTCEYCNCTYRPIHAAARFCSRACSNRFNAVRRPTP